jgi:hypothetical protein
MSDELRNPKHKRSVPPLQPELEDAQTSLECMRHVGAMFYALKEMAEKGSALCTVCTQCDALVDAHLYQGEARATFWHDAETLYFGLLERFLPEYDKRAAYTREV